MTPSDAYRPPRVPRPMSEIVARLYREYFSGGGEQGASSHWREFSDRFKVELDEHGVPVSMSGFGRAGRRG